MNIRVRPVPDAKSTYVVTRRGVELGRYCEDAQTGKWSILLPTGSGPSSARLPDEYGSATDALQAIVDAHEPEAES